MLFWMKKIVQYYKDTNCIEDELSIYERINNLEKSGNPYLVQLIFGKSSVYNI